MRKTNAKETREAIRNYLLEIGQHEDTPLNTIQEIKNKFINEKPEEIRDYGMIRACKSWLQGIGIDISVATHEIAELLAIWLDDTKENQMKMIEKHGENLYYDLLAREIVNAK